MKTTSPRILVVDDDRSIRDSLVAFLGRHRYRVEVAADAAVARHRLATERFDLVLLDVMMPGEDGLSLCRALAGDPHQRIIFLSARTDIADRVAGLRAGSDDYLCKPFDPLELLARIEAVLRRADTDREAADGVGFLHCRFDRWTLDVERRLLTRDDAVVFALSGGELQLLLAFLTRPGRVLGRERLIELIGGEPADVFDRSVDSRVSRIRRKLERDPRRPTLIRTVRGDGYRLDTTVERDPVAHR